MSLKIGVIISTTRPTRLGRKVADWFMDQVKNSDMQFDLIDLAEINLPFLDEPESPSNNNYVRQSTKDWSKKIEGYDGYVFVTAEYNHGYPAPLKNAIDTLYHEWAKKPVAFMGYGAMGAARSIEQLANVVAQVGGMPLSSTSSSVRIIDVWAAFDEAGTVKPEFIKGHVEGLLRDLSWWGEALKTARQAS